MRLSYIPQEFIDEYDLVTSTWDGWVYFEICKGVYGLLQAVILANNLLRKWLGTAGYYRAATTPFLWLHKWLTIMFYLILYDLCIEYVEEHHATQLPSAMEEY